MPPRALTFVVITLGALLGSTADADDFSAARYEPGSDQLVVTIRYRGTTPDHGFTVKWGACKNERGEPTVSADVLDSQYLDATRRNFSKTVRFDLAGLPCRPARVVLHLEPRFYVEVRVPAAP